MDKQSLVCGQVRCLAGTLMTRKTNTGLQQQLMFWGECVVCSAGRVDVWPLGALELDIQRGVLEEGSGTVGQIAVDRRFKAEDSRKL